jgi:hypothetical protein
LEQCQQLKEINKSLKKVYASTGKKIQLRHQKLEILKKRLATKTSSYEEHGKGY